MQLEKTLVGVHQIRTTDTKSSRIVLGLFCHYSVILVRVMGAYVWVNNEQHQIKEQFLRYAKLSDKDSILAAARHPANHPVSNIKLY
jgi:hypothetical protein